MRIRSNRVRGSKTLKPYRVCANAGGHVRDCGGRRAGPGLPDGKDGRIGVVRNPKMVPNPEECMRGQATCAIAEAVAPFLACPTANTDVLASCTVAFASLIASPVCAAALARAAVCDTAFLCQNVAPVLGFPGCASIFLLRFSGPEERALRKP